MNDVGDLIAVDDWTTKFNEYQNKRSENLSKSQSHRGEKDLLPPE